MLQYLPLAQMHTVHAGEAFEVHPMLEPKLLLDADFNARNDSCVASVQLETDYDGTCDNDSHRVPDVA